MRRRQPHNRSLPTGTAATGLLVLTLLAGCTGGETGLLDPEGARTVQQALVVSEPVPLAQSGPQAVSGAIAADSVAWVSLPPGTVPDGEWVSVNHRGTGAGRTAFLINGGIDPIAIPAAVGDTLDIVIQRVSLPPLQFFIVVPPWIPPIIVRTDPPKRKIDVPLTFAPYVVFSEPMDERTITTASVQLLRGGQAVAGSVTLAADGIRAYFEPDDRLRDTTEYVLRVTTDVADRAGDQLEAALEIEFTTELGPPPVAAVSVRPDTATIVRVSSLEMAAIVTDSTGTVLTGREVTWSSSDETVAYVASNGVVAAIGGWQGPRRTVTITATVEGVSGRAEITVGPIAFASVTAGIYHTCALTAAGRAYCWGSNWWGHLGIAPEECSFYNNEGEHACAVVPHMVWPGLRLPHFTELGLGNSFTCALDTGGAVYCWGLVPPEPSLRAPLRMAEGISFTTVSAGERHACALTVTGSVYCWGSNASGQLGDGSRTDRNDPVLVLGGLTFTELSAGKWRHTCGVTAEGNAYCWGRNFQGQLGNGQSGPDQLAPVAVTGGLRYTALAPGQSHTCGLTSTGSAYCWGSNSSGELGNGESGTMVNPAPVAVTGDLTFVSLSSGSDFSCGLTTTGKAFCWGANKVGQLGNGNTRNSDTPTAVSGSITFTSISVGAMHVCGRASDSGLYCWGMNGGGALGIGGTSLWITDLEASPVLVLGSR